MCVSRPLWWTLLHLWERSQHELPESKIYYTWVLTSWYMSLSLAWSACQHAHMRYDTAIKAKKLPLQFKVTSGLWTLTLAVRKGYPAGIGCLNKGMSSKLCLTLSAPPPAIFPFQPWPSSHCVCLHALTWSTKLMAVCFLCVCVCEIWFTFKFQSLDGCQGGKTEIKTENRVCSGKPDLGKQGNIVEGSLCSDGSAAPPQPMVDRER